MYVKAKSLLCYWAGKKPWYWYGNDKQIDQLVYKLYGLTEEEIEIVESELH
jgi:hypothetical protein